MKAKTVKVKEDSYKNTLLQIKWLGENAKTTFAYLAGVNRSIYPSQVTKLANSINKMGIIRPIVVTEISFINGKKTKYIVDGQHLFNALIRNNMDIPYVTINIKDKQDLVETIAKLNASSKNWTLFDYMTAWSSLNENYVKLNHYFQVYDIELNILASILSDANSCASGGLITKKIKDGLFTVVNEKENVKIIEYLTDVLKIIPRMNRYENRYACSEFYKFAKSNNLYNHEKFISLLNKNKDKFILATQGEGKLSDLFKKMI
jgi:hypothetical protein